MRLEGRSIARFRKLLLAWARKNLREFPWRGEGDTYRVLLSEMMLRRTRASQVVPVFKEFVRRYPTLEELTRAPTHDVRSVLRPLGLHWRADDIATMAREVAEHYQGVVPASRDDLQSLTGVGEYVSNAVACFSAGASVPIIDTNVVRVLSRVFGLRLGGEARRRKEIREAASACVDRGKPALYNYALLDFAAALCTARAPLCGQCPYGQRSLCEFARKAEGVGGKTRAAQRIKRRGVSRRTRR